LRWLCGSWVPGVWVFWVSERKDRKTGEIKLVLRPLIFLARMSDNLNIASLYKLSTHCLSGILAGESLKWFTKGKIMKMKISVFAVGAALLLVLMMPE